MIAPRALAALAVVLFVTAAVILGVVLVRPTATAEPTGPRGVTPSPCREVPRSTVEREIPGEPFVVVVSTGCEP